MKFLGFSFLEFVGYLLSVVVLKFHKIVYTFLPL